MRNITEYVLEAVGASKDVTVDVADTLDSSIKEKECPVKDAKAKHCWGIEDLPKVSLYIKPNYNEYWELCDKAQQEKCLNMFFAVAKECAEMVTDFNGNFELQIPNNEKSKECKPYIRIDYNGSWVVFLPEQNQILWTPRNVKNLFDGKPTAIKQIAKKIVDNGMKKYHGLYGEYK